MWLFISLQSEHQSYLKELFQVLTTIPFPYILYIKHFKYNS